MQIVIDSDYVSGANMGGPVSLKAMAAAFMAMMLIKKKLKDEKSLTGSISKICIDFSGDKTCTSIRAQVVVLAPIQSKVRTGKIIKCLTTCKPGQDCKIDMFAEEILESVAAACGYSRLCEVHPTAPKKQPVAA